MENQDKTLLHLQDLSLYFGAVKSLEKVRFSVQENDILAIIGPNGAGKTSVINCVTGYYQPQNGQIFFKKQNIAGLPPNKIARMGISRTFQNPTTYPSMTTLEILMAARYMHTRSNLLENLIYLGRSRREEIESRRKAEEIISFTHIEDLRKKPIGMLSYGQRKQVEIARVLTMEPELLLLDEPMSGLDDVMKEIMTELIMNVHQSGTTIVMVEHDMQFVMGISRSIVVLNFGEKIAEGSPEEISRNTRVAEAYLGK
ncbi:MAG: ABC transporter ATP-binding protein [Dehalococcoidales bacterium]|nr:ABC transporter ATP-binding protein [Dehalococcoidales bacterium]